MSEARRLADDIVGLVITTGDPGYAIQTLEEVFEELGSLAAVEFRAAFDEVLEF